MKKNTQQWEDLISELIIVNSEIISTQNEFQITDSMQNRMQILQPKLITDIPKLETCFVFQKTLKQITKLFQKTSDF